MLSQRRHAPTFGREVSPRKPEPQCSSESENRKTAEVSRLFVEHAGPPWFHKNKLRSNLFPPFWARVDFLSAKSRPFEKSCIERCVAPLLFVWGRSRFLLWQWPTTFDRALGPAPFSSTPQDSFTFRRSFSQIRTIPPASSVATKK